jgi:hypothetical protein
MIAVGASLESAPELAIEVETLAETYWCALQIGEPVLLSDDEMAARAMERPHVAPSRTRRKPLSNETVIPDPPRCRLLLRSIPERLRQFVVCA